MITKKERINHRHRSAKVFVTVVGVAALLTLLSLVGYAFFVTGGWWGLLYFTAILTLATSAATSALVWSSGDDKNES